MTNQVIISKEFVYGLRQTEHMSHPQVILINGTNLDTYFSFGLRDFDFSKVDINDIDGNLSDKYTQKIDQNVLLILCPLLDKVSLFIADMLYNDRNILERLLK